MDPDYWNWDALEEGVPVCVQATIFSMRLTRDEHHLLANAAYRQGITPHEFVKRVTLAAPRADDANRQATGTPHAARA